MKKVLLVLGAAVVLATACATGGGSSKAANLEGFEGEDLQWFAVVDGWKDGDNSTELTTSDKNATEGKMSAKLVANIKAIDKPATYYTENAAVQDWSKFKTLKLDVNNTLGADTKVVVAVCTGDNWDWQESEPVAVKAGLNKAISFDIVTGNWKGAGTNWEFKKIAIHDLDKVKRVVFRYFGAKTGPAEFYIDNLNLE